MQKLFYNTLLFCYFFANFAAKFVSKSQIVKI